MVTAIAGAAAVLAIAAADPALQLSGGPDVRLQWKRVISSDENDWINDLVLLRNGNIAAAGFIGRRDDPPSDWIAIVTEIGPDGAVVRQSDYGAGSGVDAFFGMHEAEDGRLVMAGFTNRIGHGGIDGLAMLAAEDGTIISESAHGGSGYDRFTDVAPAADGYVFLGHSQAEHSDKRRVFLVKTDREGRKLWERIHDAPESWGALYIEPAPGGGFIVAGGTSIDGDRDMFAMEIDGEGREVWRKRVGTPDWNEVNHGLVVRADGDIVLVGYANPGAEQPNDVVAATLSADGETTRIERWGGSADDRAILARPDRDGRIWIVGHTASAGAGGDDAFVTSLNANGEFEGGAAVLGGAEDDRGTAILPLGDGSLVVAGYSRSIGSASEDAFVVRLSAPSRRVHPGFRRQVVRAP